MFKRNKVNYMKDKELNEDEVNLIVGGYNCTENESSINTATNSSTNNANTASSIMRDLKETLSNR